jgi:hypothetical protein
MQVLNKGGCDITNRFHYLPNRSLHALNIRPIWFPSDGHTSFHAFLWEI